MTLNPASHFDFERIHRLLVKCGLVVEADQLLSAQKLMHARNFIICNTEGEVVLWVGYHDLRGEQCQMSVAVDPEWQGKLWTKGLLRQMFGIPFKEFGVMALRMGLSNPKTVASLLSLGIKLDYDEGDVVLAKESYEGKFGMRESL